MVVDQSLSCFIYDNNTGSMVIFNIEKPEGYTDSYTANFQQQDVRARSSPFQSYVNSGPRSISFSVILSLDYRRDLDKQTDAIRKMMKPLDRGSGVIVKAPYLHVRIGNALEIDAIPQSFSAEWSEGYKEGVYRLCTWSFSFVEVEDKSSYNEAFENAESIVPSGMEYITNNVSTPILYGIGDEVEVYQTDVVYKSSNDANNRINGNELESGTYVVTNIKGDALELGTEIGKPGDVGWIVM